MWLPPPRSGLRRGGGEEHAEVSTKVTVLRMTGMRDGDDPFPAPTLNVSARGVGRWAWSLETKRPGVGGMKRELIPRERRRPGAEDI